ncbi:MAG: A/G-specific adenine glycosylase [Flavobacteriales bacterium]|nr:A/G-specific adenine glycosylase [Flavobacteriales bacterium]
MKISHFPNTQLLDWYHRVKRDLPWRETSDPYRIWLSEIILQQTRVDQGLPYYERFVTNFPSVKNLAEAPEDDVMKLWEGLGYYSRARNLHFTAKYIHCELEDEFPNTHEGLLQLKGVGPYTAAAIGSIAFNLPVAAVDGNVYRVMARYFGISESIDETSTQKEIDRVANAVIPTGKSGDHNQAVMELGATVCTPVNPLCEECPLKFGCMAFEKNLQTELPVRSKKTKVRDRFFYYMVRWNGDAFEITKRGAGDIWQGLYEFPLLEADKRLKDEAIIQQLNLKKDETIVSISEEFKHILSHQRIFAKFILVKTEHLNSDYLHIKNEDLRTFAFPRLINRYLDKNLVIDREV